MKKTAIIVVLIWALLVSVLLPLRQKAYADPMTIAQISSLAYGLGNSFGLNFTMSGLTSEGANQFLQNSLNSWLAGSSIAEKFGAEQARLLAGKLIIPYQLYNGIREFLGQFVTDNSINSADKQISLTTGGYSYSFGGFFKRDGNMWSAWSKVNVQTGESQTIEINGWGDSPMYTANFIGIRLNGSTVQGGYERFKWGSSIGERWNDLGTSSGTISRVSSSLDGSIPETVLNPDQAWSGTLGGQDWPDTNLDQLLGHIDDMVIDGTLDIDGEIVDPPVPPTPVPTIEPGDIDGYWNRQSEQLEGLGNDIGDISGKLDDLGTQAGNITDALEGVNEGIQTQTGVISGALDQATEDVIDAIGEQTGVLDESLTQTAEGVQEIVDALQPGEIEPRQFDLRRLFPFCIPFDIHNLLQKFNAEPVAPHVQLPFVIQSIGFSYMFDLDFSAFDPVAAAMRTVEFIVFAIGLAWATSKVIKW